MAPTFFHFFMAIQLLGSLLLAAVLLTSVFAATVRRHVLWKNYIFTWIIFTLSYTLLLVTGQQMRPVPALHLCMVQVILTYSAPSLCAFSGVSLIIQLLAEVTGALKRVKHGGPFLTALLVAGPYVIYAVNMFGIATFAIQDPEPPLWSWDKPYCHMVSPLYGQFTGAIVILACSFSVISVVYIAVILYRHACTRRWSPTLYRLAAFTIALGTSIVVTPQRFLCGKAFNGVLAILPLLNVFIFGLQADIISVWCFWRPPSNIMQDVDYAHNGADDRCERGDEGTKSG